MSNNGNNIILHGNFSALNPIVILTRTDLVCDELKKDGGDVTNVFHSQAMYEKVGPDHVNCNF